MPDYTIAKDKAVEWLARLGERYAIYAPGADGMAFERTADYGSALQPSGNTRRPPKEAFFPASQTLLTFRRSEDGMEIAEAVSDSAQAEPRLLVGVRPCDATALSLLDTVFSQEYSGYEDPYYRSARSAIPVISLVCAEPLEGCFCGDAPGVDLASPPADVVLTDLGDRYFAEAKSETGQELVAAGSEWFQAAGDDDRAARDNAASDLRARTAEGLPLAEMREKLAGLHESPLWKELSQKCVRCGVCSFLCPTCHCFDIQDEMLGTTGCRYRCWDTCQFTDFTLMTSGENPRRDPAERLKQRICHKLEYLPERTDAVYCVGCGRCVRLCPVGMDVRETIVALAAAPAAGAHEESSGA
ncbi:MAG: 4Fe-4S dicluster domain-containing protein [Armatimonadota bacterium]|nr:MAG: 4Fe-4S dicluster domain-containing protein [Armatimonadota bacterium]